MDQFNEMFEDEFNDEMSNIEQDRLQYELSNQIKDKLARANYNAIIKHGIDTQALNQPKVIRAIVEETLIYFEEIEEYEKCAKLKEIISIF